MKCNVKGIDVSYYKETLDNGLGIYLLPFKDKQDYVINYFTRYGSEISEFIPGGEKEYVKVPDGVAHFLEHKLFEMEDGEEAFSLFSKSGADCNACTSYDYTKYWCSGNTNFKENLEIIIDLVNKPHFTDKNVEKEKGIIIEELKMYDDYPDYVLDQKLRESLFNTNPRRIDVGGTKDSVSNITKEDLYLCYNNFYAPNNMYIVISGNFDEEEALKIIKDKMKNIKKCEVAKVKEIHEKDEVSKEYLEIKNKEVNITKVGLGVKFKFDDNTLDEIEKSLYLQLLFSIKYGDTSLFKENMINNNISNNNFYYYENARSHYALFIEGTTNNYDKFIKSIKDELINSDISEDDFNRKKKVMIASEIKKLDSITSGAAIIVRDLIEYNKYYDNKIDIIRNLSYDKLLKIYKKLDFNNISIVKIVGK